MTSACIIDIRVEGSTGVVPIALFSDTHLEARDCDLGRLRDDLKHEHDRGARMLFNGDMFDGILPSDKKRFTSGRDVSCNDAKLNNAIDLAYDLLEPYVNNIDYMGVGNHEISILKYHNFDMIMALAARLNAVRDKSLPPIFRGGYQGYIRYRFNTGKGNGPKWTYTIFHHHGAGGSSPVTKGMIDINRLSSNHVANLYWLGHKHSGVQDPYIMRDRLNMSGRIVVERCHAVYTPGYKHPKMIDDYKDGYVIDYSDGFYGMQAQGYVQLNLKLNGTTSLVTAETISK